MRIFRFPSEIIMLGMIVVIKVPETFYSFIESDFYQGANVSIDISDSQNT